MKVAFYLLLALILGSASAIWLITLTGMDAVVYGGASGLLAVMCVATALKRPSRSS